MSALQLLISKKALLEAVDKHAKYVFENSGDNLFDFVAGMGALQKFVYSH